MRQELCGHHLLNVSVFAPFISRKTEEVVTLRPRFESLLCPRVRPIMAASMLYASIAATHYACIRYKKGED